MTIDERCDASILSRRALLRGTIGAGLAATTATLLAGCGSGTRSRGTAAVEGPPETTRIRLPKIVLTTVAAQAVAWDFLKEEGFAEVEYVDPGRPETLFSKFAAFEFDMFLYPAPMAVTRIDAGDPITVLAGVNAGVFQVVGAEAIKSLRDFKGKTIATSGPGQPDHVFLAVTLANVGIDIRTDITVLTRPHSEAARALAAREVEGMVSYPPFIHELRVRGVGHVVLDANVDRPWSQNFFSMVAVHREFMTHNPIATKRALRAILRAADVVAKDPDRGARAMVDRGLVGENLFEATRAELPAILYDVWRRYDPADTLRFYGLRLAEAGFIQSTPEQIVARGTDFRYLDELKQELKEG